MLGLFRRNRISPLALTPMDLSPYRLDVGSHSLMSDIRCAMEWASWLEGHPEYGANPRTVDVIVRKVCIALNDNLPANVRQLLKPYIARAIGTLGDEYAGQRSVIARQYVNNYRGKLRSSTRPYATISDVVMYLVDKGQYEKGFELLNALLPTEELNISYVAPERREVAEKEFALA